MARKKSGNSSFFSRMKPERSGSHKSTSKSYRGHIKRNPDGFGFFISSTEEIEDIYIPKEEMAGVFSNDLVEITVNRRRGKFGTRGKIKKILERDSNQFVGRLHYDKKQKAHYLKDSAHSWGQDLWILEAKGYEENELVIVEVQKYPQLGEDGRFGNQSFCGKIISSLGQSHDPNTDNKRILAESNVPIEFSAKALKEARALGAEVKEKDKKGRRDLRSLPLITIDGVTAKDFDDAVYVEKKTDKKGTDFYKLYVAIADVSHYVKTAGALDREAYEKGTSVYLANYVCPMLPEEISNGLCSLNPKVDRLCFCCEMDLDLSGQVVKYEFYEALMNSHARVTYGEAQEIIEQDKDSEEVQSQLSTDFPPAVAKNILAAAELAEILNQKRKEEGAVDFDVPSIKVLVNDLGEATDLVKEERVFAHRLIEELMLVTNICAARFFEDKKLGVLYRVHESPENEDLKKLRSTLKSFLNLSVSKIQSSFDFQKISERLKEIERPTLKNIAQSFILRSMKQAQYSSQNVGHFGLSFTDYAHFTSPIRRYPDLVVHRQIKSFLYKSYKPYSEEDLSSMGAILSAAEQRAVKTERKLISIKRARFFESFVGREFDGYISSVVKFGTFVTLIDYPLDGLVKIEDLGGDYFIFDDEAMLLKGKKTGRVFKLGDRVRVLVAKVDVLEGKIDFDLVSHEAGESIKGEPEKAFSKNKGRRSTGSKKSSSKKTEGLRRKASKTKNSNSEKESKTSGSKKSKSSKKGSKRTGASSLFSSSSNARGLSFGGGAKGKGKKRKK